MTDVPLTRPPVQTGPGWRRILLRAAARIGLVGSVACHVTSGRAQVDTVHAGDSDVGKQDSGQMLDLPPRPPGAPGGSGIARDIRALDLDAREARVRTEFASGNVPAWLRTLVPVEMRRTLDGVEHRIIVHVTPDYLAVGSDADYLLVPLTPGSAQRIADVVHASLPTPPIVDAVWAAAVRLGPDSIPPSPAMTTVPVFEEHDRLVRARRDRADAPPGTLVAGHKKDVVLTARLDTLPGRVAIYGWHRPDGRPIQPLYTGHSARYADYSHGIRLVSRTVLIDGVEHDLRDVLRDPALADLLSDDGPITGGYLRPPQPSAHLHRNGARAYRLARPGQAGGIQRRTTTPLPVRTAAPGATGT